MQVKGPLKLIALALMPVALASCSKQDKKEAIDTPASIVVNEKQSVSTGDVFIDFQIKRLNAEESSVRREAIETLCQTKSTHVIQPLLLMLRDEEPNVREAAAHAMGELKAKEAVDQLIILTLADKVSYVQNAAITALGEIGDKKASETLLSIALNSKKENAYQVVLAFESLSKVIGSEAIRPIARYLATTKSEYLQTSLVELLGKTDKEKATAELTGMLKSDEYGYKEAATIALGKLKAKEATPSLIDLLNDRNSDLTWRTINSLGEIGDSRATLPLCNLLKNAEPGHNERIIEALGKIKDKAATPYLINYLNHNSEYVRGRIMWTFGEIGDKSATEVIAKRLKFDDDEHVRRNAAEALEKLADPKALETLHEVRKILAEYQGDDSLKEAVDKAIAKTEEAQKTSTQ